MIFSRFPFPPEFRRPRYEKTGSVRGHRTSQSRLVHQDRQIPPLIPHSPFRKWCRDFKPRKIKQRFGAVGEYGSIALIERAIRSMKHECTRRIIVPLRADDMRRELTLFFDWYNQYRPHQGLDGRIPMDVYLGIRDGPPEFETRGNEAVLLRLQVSYLEGRRHLPIVELEPAA